MLELDKIYNMDCMEGLKEIDNNSVDVIITDPPYSLPNTNFRPEARIMQKTFGDFSTYIYFFKSFIKECKRVLKNDGDLILFSDEIFYAVLFPILYENFYATKMVIWNKERIGMGGIWRRQFEIIIHAYLKPKKEKSGDGDIIKCKPIVSSDKIHNAQKPIELIKKILLKVTKENCLVLDPFIGSGSSAIACIGVDRHYIGFEISEDIYNLSLQRLIKYKKQKRLGM